MDHAGSEKGSAEGDGDALVKAAAGAEVQRMELSEINGRLARVLMVVRMVEEQSDLTAFLLPVRLSLPSSAAASLNHEKPEAVDGGDQGLEGDASSSSDSSDDDEEEEEEGEGGAARAVKGKGGNKVVEKGKGKGKGGGAGELAGGKKRMLAIERLRYHKKVR